MVFCNTKNEYGVYEPINGHNPYFNRWFSAIYGTRISKRFQKICHNPYFNRWFSAILDFDGEELEENVTILILIDGFLQYQYDEFIKISSICHNPYFNRWFSAINSSKMFMELYTSHNPYFNRWFSAIKDFGTK